MQAHFLNMVREGQLSIIDAHLMENVIKVPYLALNHKEVAEIYDSVNFNSKSH